MRNNEEIHLFSDETRVDVIEVFQELEIRYSDTSRIDQHIREYKNSIIDQNFLTLFCGRSISGFSQYLAIQFIRVSSEIFNKN